MNQSQQFSNLVKKALAVRDHYDELQKTDGREKWDASDRMAGFVADIGELSELVMVKKGKRRGPKDIDAAVAHELSDCLWSIMVLADELGVDLEQAFSESMEELHERIEREKAEA